MTGDGPLNGFPTDLRTVLLADDPVSADATLARLIKVDPDRISHLREAGRFLGNTEVSKSFSN